MISRAHGLWIGAFVAIALLACRSERPSLVYRLDSELRGWIVIVFDRPGAPPLSKQGDAYVVDVPRSGVLSTNTTSPVGRAVDIFRYRYPDGRETSVPPDAIRAHHTGSTSKGAGGPMQYEVFFLGTESELDAAEPEERVLSRVYASML